MNKLLDDSATKHQDLLNSLETLNDDKPAAARTADDSLDSEGNDRNIVLYTIIEGLDATPFLGKILCKQLCACCTVQYTNNTPTNEVALLVRWQLVGLFTFNFLG